jgi:acyl carrier protein
LSETTKLETIPEWDSMNSINLTVELESAFGVSLLNSGVVLTGEHTLGDVCKILLERGAKV